MLRDKVASSYIFYACLSFFGYVFWCRLYIHVDFLLIFCRGLIFVLLICIDGHKQRSPNIFWFSLDTSQSHNVVRRSSI